MKLYFSKGACSLASRIVMNEVGQACEYELVDLKTKKTASGGDFLKISAKGAVPVLELDSGEILTENSVIQQYLADTYSNGKLLPPVGDFERYRVLEWLNFIGSDLHKGLGLFVAVKLPEDFKEKSIIPMLERKIDYVNTELEGKNYLISNHFTLPDAYLFVMITWMRNMRFNLNKWPHLDNYFNKIKDYPAVAKSLQQEGITLAPMHSS